MPIAASRSEKILSCLGALVGLVITERFSMSFLGATNHWFIAPMGASAVLLFAVPSSPLAQPWSIMGGNIISAFIGVTCAVLIPDRGLAVGISVALAIAFMFRLRCLHPPSGAVALTAVLGGPAVASLGYRFVLYPVAVNSFALTSLALFLNAVTRRKYPHRHVPQGNPHQTKDLIPSERLGITPDDLEEAMENHAGLLDISKEDLLEILNQAEVLAYRRRFGDVICSDIMSRDVVVVRCTDNVSIAWHLLMEHSLRALPVVNDFDELVGIMTLHDVFVSRIDAEKKREPMSYRPSVKVEDIMTTIVFTAHPDQPIAELVALLSDGGVHVLPVVDSINHVVGVLAQSDLIAGLYHSQIHGPMNPAPVKPIP